MKKTLLSLAIASILPPTHQEMMERVTVYLAGQLYFLVSTGKAIKSMPEGPEKDLHNKAFDLTCKKFGEDRCGLIKRFNGI